MMMRKTYILRLDVYFDLLYLVICFFLYFLYHFHFLPGVFMNSNFLLLSYFVLPKTKTEYQSQDVCDEQTYYDESPNETLDY